MADAKQIMMVPDASVEALFAARRGKPVPDYGTLTVDAARANFAAAHAATFIEAPHMAEVRDISESWEGKALHLRLYRPTAVATAQPALVFFHGGGWVLGGFDSHDHICRFIAAEAGVAVIAVDYPLSPETRYPGAVNNGLAAMRCIFAHADELGLDPARIAVGGDSAGGNLAAVMAQKSRDGLMSPLMAQVLLYPLLDLTMSGTTYENAHPDLSVSADAIAWYIGHYLPQGISPNEGDASPLHVESVEGLCPAYVLIAGCDVVADDGVRYARRLHEAGVDVMEKCFPGQIHAFLALPHLLPEAGQAFSEIAKYLSLRASLKVGEFVAAPPR